MREAVWGRHPFLGEEGREEDKGGKRVGCSPWRMTLAALAALADTVAGIAVGMVAGTVASALACIVVLVAKESSPLFPPQSTEASSEPA